MYELTNKVGAAAPSLPTALVEQLAKPGRMVIPLGTADQALYIVDKDAEGNVSKRPAMGVRYVPLTDAAAQYED
jgi:protein-L-isoaspartate(D-aspartate) O-methyltransferase